MITLRPYQDAAIRGISAAFRESRSVLLVKPTGAGKTVVFSFWAANAYRKGKRVLILAHREELIRQISRSLLSFGISDFGTHARGFKEDGRALIQVGMYLTVLNRADRLAVPDYIIIDECHHALADTWRQLLSIWPESKVLGVTATPVRGDGLGLGRHCGGIFDQMVLGPSFMDLLSLGQLCRPVHLRPKRSIDFSSVKIVKGEYDTREQSKVMNKALITGDSIELYRKHIDGCRMIVFCVDVNHAQSVTAMYSAAGIPAEFICGDKKICSDELREAIVERFRRADTLVLVNVKVCEEGFDVDEQRYPDVPPLMAVCLLAKTNSLSVYLQRCGRGSRPVKGKKAHFFVFDQVDNFLIHGGCWWDRDWSLDGEEPGARRKVMEKAEKWVRCERCDACYEPAPVCPECGHMKARKEIGVQDGDFYEVTVGGDQDAAAMQLQRTKAEKAAERQRKNQEKAERQDAARERVARLAPRLKGKVGFELRNEIKAVADEAAANGSAFGLQDLHAVAEAIGLSGKPKNGFVIKQAREMGIPVPFLDKK